MRNLGVLVANALGIACWLACALAGLFMAAAIAVGANEHGASHFTGAAILTGFWLAACWAWRPVFNF